LNVEDGNVKCYGTIYTTVSTFVSLLLALESRAIKHFSSLLLLLLFFSPLFCHSKHEANEEKSKEAKVEENAV
jgi:hypothetical protein